MAISCFSYNGVEWARNGKYSVKRRQSDLASFTQIADRISKFGSIYG